MCECVCVWSVENQVGFTSTHRSASRSCWQRSSVNSDLLTQPQRAENHGKTGGEDREGKDQRGEKKRRKRGNMKVKVKSLGGENGTKRVKKQDWEKIWNILEWGMGERWRKVEEEWEGEKEGSSKEGNLKQRQIKSRNKETTRAVKIKLRSN